MNVKHVLGLMVLGVFLFPIKLHFFFFLIEKKKRELAQGLVCLYILFFISCVVGLVFANSRVYNE